MRVRARVRVRVRVRGAGAGRMTRFFIHVDALVSWGIALFYMKEPLRLDFLWAELCLLGAVFFMFRRPHHSALAKQDVARIAPDYVHLLRTLAVGILLAILAKPGRCNRRTGMAGIGRNDPCPCGSGKKFKHCCLGKEGRAAPNESATNASEALRKALEGRQFGCLKEIQAFTAEHARQH